MITSIFLFIAYVYAAQMQYEVTTPNETWWDKLLSYTAAAIWPITGLVWYSLLIYSVVKRLVKKFKKHA